MTAWSSREGGVSMEAGRTEKASHALLEKLLPLNSSAKSIGMSRRSLFLLGGGTLAAACIGGLSGCSSDAYDPHTKQGFASDTEIKDYDVEVRVLADENLVNNNAADGVGRVEEYFLKYQEVTGRGNVTFAIKYLDSVSMAVECMSSFEDECDIVIGLDSTIDLGVESGTLYGGQGGASVRDLYSALSENVIVVRKKGSTVDMPAAATLSGEDAADGSITKMQSLPNFEGKIGVASDSFIEGVLANRVLYRAGLYSVSSGIGGEYDSKIKDKVLIHNDIRSLASAISSGACGLGFMLQSSLWGSYGGLEKVYGPSYGSVGYKGASTTNANEGGVGRDFLEYVSHIV